MGAYQLKNEELTLTVISAGAEMKSLKDNKTEQEYLWQADPKFWGRTSPVLFPIVGNYVQKQSVYEGKTYTLSQHGFARDMEFDLESQTEEEIWFVLKDTESTLEKYPFHFYYHSHCHLLIYSTASFCLLSLRKYFSMDDISFIVPFWRRILWNILFGGMVIVATGGNLIVVWIVMSTKRMRTVTNYFIGKFLY